MMLKQTRDIESIDLKKILVGSKKVCLGTDYPFPLGELEPGELIKNSNFPKDVKEKEIEG